MKQINFELGELQAFLAVAETLNFMSAAEGLFLSQPALSRRIGKLEEALKARLFERTTRRVALTEAGARFLVHAKAVVDELEAAVLGLDEQRAQRNARVVVACVPTAMPLLSRVLAAFLEAHPAVRIRIHDEGAREVLAQVVSGDADFGIDFTGAQEPDIQFKAISEAPFVLVMRPDHPLASRRSVAWGDIKGERLLSVAAGSGNRTLLDNALARVSRRPAVFHEASHVAGVLALVEAGLGIAALPELALPAPGLVGVPLVRPAVTRTLGLIRRKGRHLQPAAEILFRMVEAAHVLKPLPADRAAVKRKAPIPR